MDYKRFGDKLLLRVDRGEEILASLEKVVRQEGITLGQVQALGAVGKVTAGLYDVSKQQYNKTTLTGDFEIVSLTGTVDTMNGEYYSHLHISVSDHNFQVWGGHLNEAVVSGTCELVLTVIHGAIDRQKDPQVGLNVWKFN